MKDKDETHPRLHIAEPEHQGPSQNYPDTDLGCGWGCLLPLIMAAALLAIAVFFG